MLKDFNRRFLMSTISIVALFVLLLFAYQAFFQYFVALATAGLTAIAIWEYEQFAKVKGGQMISSASMAISGSVVLAFFISAKWPLFGPAPLIVFFIGFLILFALHFKKNDGAIVDLAVSSFGLLYIAVPMGMILGILYLPTGLFHEDGRWWIAYLILVTKITDVGAYFAGSLWGKRKLAPRISPGKTVEGALFGLFCALAASIGFYFLSISANIALGSLTLVQAIVLGFVLGVTGQFGDLSESLLKRDANKKDSNALPGLGGVLDSIDSLLFTSPIIYLYLKHVHL